MPVSRRRSSGVGSSSPISNPAPANTGMGLKDLFPTSMQEGVDKVGDWLGTATRVGGGFFGASGGIPGAVAGGGSEALAEFLESSLDKGSWARVGTEAGIGTIPFGKLANSKRALTAIGKTAAATGLGDLGRQAAEGNFMEGGPGLQTGRLGLAALLGGVSGGVFNKLQPGQAIPTAEKVVIESSGAVPRDVAQTGLPMTAPKTDASSNVSFQGREPIPANQTVLSAGRAVPHTSNYSGGVTEITGLGASSAPTTLHGPRTLAGRVPYSEAGNLADETGIIDDLERQFSSAMNTADTRFNAMQPKAAKAAPLQPSVEDEMMEMLNKFPNRPLTNASKDLDEVLGNIAEERARRANKVEAVRTQTEKEAKEEAKRQLIQRRRKEAGLEPETSFSSSVRSTTPTGVTETMTTKFRPPQADDDAADEGVAALQKLLSGAETPEAAAVIQEAAKGATGRTAGLISNLDEEGMKMFNHLRYMGESDGSAYKKAIYDQEVRKARAGRTAAVRGTEEAVEPAVQEAVNPYDYMNQMNRQGGGLKRTPNTTDADNLGALKKAIGWREKARVKQSAHPSFYDEGFEGLEDASTAGKPASRVPPAAQAKLAEAEATYQPEALAELKRLSAIYNDPATDKATRNQIGKELRQLSQFMSGGAPKKGKGGITLGAGLGGGQDILRIMKENPEFASSVIFGAGGALTGAAIDSSNGDDSAWDGALAGLAVGAGAPHLPKLVAAARAQIDPANAESVRQMAAKIVHKLPQIQRASLLADPIGLPANAFAGPYGAVMMHAVESILKGDVERGTRLLKMAYNPAKFIKGMWDSKDEAWEALVRGEEGRQGSITAINPDSHLDKALAYPGQWMTMGDIYARKLLALAGYSPEEARLATLTNEPNRWRPLANAGKNNWLMQMMFPFRRTPVNILEQGLQRTPGVGFLPGVRGAETSLDDVIREQLLGAGVIGANYLEAANVDDDTSRRNMRRFATNLGGRYALPATIGQMFGDAKARNLKGIRAVVNEQNAKNIFPLPSTDVVTDAITKGVDIANGEADSLGDFIPTSLSFKALRRGIADLDDKVGQGNLRRLLGVKSEGVSRKSRQRRARRREQ